MTERFNIKDNFVERNDVSDFLRESRVNSELYDIVLRMVGDRNLSPRQLTGIFNNAYRICTIATSPLGILEDVQLLLGRLDDLGFGYCFVTKVVAWCLLRIHEGLIYISEEIVRFLYDTCRYSDAYSSCHYFVRNNAGELTCPINFSGQRLRPAASAPVQRPEERFMEHHAQLLESARDLIRQNEALRAQAAEAEEKLATETAVWRSQQKLLQQLVDRYREVINEKDLIIEELRRKQLHTTARHDPRRSQGTPQAGQPAADQRQQEEPGEKALGAQVVNLANLVRFAISLPKDEEAILLATLLRELCTRYRYFEPEAFDLIDSIQTERDKARQEMERKRERKAGASIYHIDHVDQLNPSAQSVENNNYERRSVSQQLGQLLPTGEEKDPGWFDRMRDSMLNLFTEEDE